MFTSREGWSDRPLELPCGQCIGCRTLRAREWALRCMHESQLHEANCFVTLTYRPADVPADGSVDVRHWQLFAKRLRKKLGPFRFFHVGEYGEQNYRPHYHACLFGIDFAADRVLVKEHDDDKLFTSETLESTWGLGFTTIGLLTMKSAAYVARYCIKKATGPAGREKYRRIDVETGEEYHVRPEYLTMSRRPGLGAGWYDLFSADVFPDDECVADGKKLRPPRYYDGLLEKADPGLFASIKEKRVDHAFKRRSDFTPERLDVRERVLEARLSRLVRSV